MRLRCVDYVLAIPDIFIYLSH